MQAVHVDQTAGFIGKFPQQLAMQIHRWRAPLADKLSNAVFSAVARTMDSTMADTMLTRHLAYSCIPKLSLPLRSRSSALKLLGPRQPYVSFGATRCAQRSISSEVMVDLREPAPLKLHPRPQTRDLPLHRVIAVKGHDFACNGNHQRISCGSDHRLFRQFCNQPALQCVIVIRTTMFRPTDLVRSNECMHHDIM